MRVLLSGPRPGARRLRVGLGHLPRRHRAQRPLLRAAAAGTRHASWQHASADVAEARAGGSSCF
eukprot:8157967-Alexandrium_andersonii.AAC.1